MATKEMSDHAEAELIAALEEASTTADNPEGAMTTREIRTKTGWCTERVLEHLHKLDDAGRLEGLKVRRRRLGGDTIRIQAYRILP